eukprot:TRINITY_DN14662_c0_g1_i6.p1 TRINITY_DN14662_c0_g1~~TRINITY_DN14662_c0_g1_i6.p1  ORF type:complete len:484 (+),score=79.56 TRINITY_DN14662_c0_g1_i6:606-2057(+)
MDKFQTSSESHPVFSMGVDTSIGPDYTGDQFFASIEQHLDIVTPPSGTYTQLTATPRPCRKRQSIKTVGSIEERHARALEKNRAAQKRFRDKQKVKLNEMESQVEELNQKVQLLQLEKEELKQQLWQSKDTSSSDSHYTEAIDQAADTEQVKKFQGTYYMKSINREISSEMIQNLHDPSIQAYVMETVGMMVAEISQRVKEIDVVFPEKEKMDRLEQVVEDERACMVRMFVINPAAAQTLSCQYQPDDAQQLQSEQQLEQQVNLTIQKMQLSETQKSVINFLWQRYCLLQVDCMKQRTEIASQLTDADARDTTQLRYYRQFTKTHKLVFRVRENWRQDYKNHWDLMSTISLQILTPLQFGRMVYYMAPNHMDFFILCRVIAKQFDSQNNTNNNTGSASQQVLSEQQDWFLQNNIICDNDSNLFVFGQQKSQDFSEILTSSVEMDPLNSVSKIKNFEQFDGVVDQKLTPNSPDSFQNKINNFQL